MRENYTERKNEQNYAAPGVNDIKEAKRHKILFKEIDDKQNQLDQLRLSYNFSETPSELEDQKKLAEAERVNKKIEEAKKIINAQNEEINKQILDQAEESYEENKSQNKSERISLKSEEEKNDSPHDFEDISDNEAVIAMKNSPIIQKKPNVEVKKEEYVEKDQDPRAF